MRVAFVLGTTSGGTGRYVLMLVRGLVRRGHRVVVAGPRSVEEQFAYTSAGARFVEVAVSDRPDPVNDVRAVLALRRVTRGADVVHAHGMRAGALAAIGRRGPVVTLHNALTTGGFVGLVYGVLERIVARRAGCVLPVSPDLGARMTTLGARDVRAALVPAPALPPAKRTPEDVRAELGAGERPVVLTIARLAQQKGLDTLLDVAAGPWPGDDSVKPLFVVAGEGPLRGELRRRIDAEGLPVVLLGNRDDVADLLGAAVALLMPSRWEGQPLTLREALMAGTPAIASAVGGIPEILGDAGILVPYGDVGGFRDAVQELLTTPGTAETLAAAAVRRGREMPDGDEAVESVLAVYRGQDPADD
ncbi:Glycosyltransferase involved in cell wall bisynthesis [Nonomuraea solani]|uniref:Glycosyltransferase involved in cell wall bisynthesis n=1 Tax=Nonomuraea solani TaxID=1144553 RepID=A0A1H6ERV1_9ACTN|nr:glycosyltransferase family 4 protein [Nonomuraea solani]SEH00588.1 Glycosyltransferase involved in cell wall bisynthesis [Nonomuraea solani]